jgi:amino acid adenylation domain-containing protein
MSKFLRTDTKLPPEQLAIRAQCFHPSGRFEEFTKEEVEQSIPERFEKIAKRYADRIAIKEGAQAVTYAELNQRANRLAHAILDRCGEGNLPVAILMEHGTSVLVAIVAALKAGKIYVPLDPSYPVERLQYMLLDSQAGLIVAHRETLSLARQMASQEFAVLDVDDVGAGSRDYDVNVKITPGAFASIFYTSGSTGQPKGVVDNHRNLLHGTLRFTNGLHICAEDRLSFTHSCSASASLRRIFPALLNGACLFPLDLKRQGIRALVDLVVSESITAFGIGRIRDFTRSFSHQSFPSLRLVSLGGEIVYRHDVEQYKRIFPRDCVIGILMSSTEAGNITQFFINRDTQLAGEIAPIGYPAEDVEIMLLDDGGDPVRLGEIGEIAIKSKYLACGYWRRPQMTDERFRADPGGGEQRIYRTGDLGRIEYDGCLFHLGRKDDQVKVRGHRVEVAEIEAALLNLGYFRKAVVTLRNRGSDEKSLVAYVEPEKRPAPTSSALRKALAATLPDHMIPSRFVMLDTIPLTPTEKIDRKALPEPGNARPEMDTPFIAPRTSLERDIAKIWGDVLSLDQVGVHDNFLDLGGHSLAAMRVISQVIQTFRVDLSPKALFDSPTVAEMAVVIEANLTTLASQDELDRMLTEVEAMSNEEAQRVLAEVNKARSKATERE